MKPGEPYQLEKDATLYAIWKKVPTYTLSFDVNGGTGSVPDVTGREDDTTFVLPGADTLTAPSGLPAFLGWNTLSDGKGTAYQPGQSYYFEQDATLYAIWAAQAITLTYDLGDNPYNEKTPAAVVRDVSGGNFSVDLPGRGQATMQKLLQWNTRPDGTGAAYAPGSEKSFNVGDGDITLYAIWAAADADMYTVNFVERDVTTYSYNVPAGSLLLVPPPKEKNYYESITKYLSFSNWYLAGEGTTVPTSEKIFGGSTISISNSATYLAFYEEGPSIFGTAFTVYVSMLGSCHSDSGQVAADDAASSTPSPTASPIPVAGVVAGVPAGIHYIRKRRQWKKRKDDDKDEK